MEDFARLGASRWCSATISSIFQTWPRAESPGVAGAGASVATGFALAWAGEHPKVVSERLGHSTVNLTLDTYSHVLPGLQQAAAERLADTLRPGR
jgi:hypothetical protein